MDSGHRFLPNNPQTGVTPRLWRSQTNRVVAGVIGGLAERLDVSATGLRWFTAILTLFSGVFPAVIIYIVLWGITTVRSSGIEADR